MTEKSKLNDRSEEMTMRVAGLVPVARLQELLNGEPKLKLEVVASRIDSPRPKPRK
jgi:hypothetical protein